MLFTPIIVGTVVGLLMAALFRRGRYIERNIVFGLLGAYTFRFAAYVVLATRSDQSHGFSLIGVLSSVVGAVLFTYVLKLFPAPERLHDIVPGSSQNKADHNDGKKS